MLLGLKPVDVSLVAVEVLAAVAGPEEGHLLFQSGMPRNRTKAIALPVQMRGRGA